MQASGGAANPMLRAATTGVQFMDPGRVAPAIAGAAAVAPPAFSADRVDSDGGSGGSGGEADQKDGMRTPERGENTERAPAPAAEVPLRRARVSVRARSEAPMVRKICRYRFMLLLSANSSNTYEWIQKNKIHMFVLACFLKFITNLVWGYVYMCV
jgi:hypothetical protein